jgi:hypothetical protein
MSAIMLSKEQWEELKGHIEAGAREHDGEYSGHPCPRHRTVHVNRTYEKERCTAICAACGHDCTSHVNINEKGFSVCVAQECRCLRFEEKS